MKIGLTTISFDPRRGGAETWIYRLALNLLARGHEVHVVAQDFPAETGQMPIVTHRLERISSPLARAAAAEAILRTLKLDLIHDMGMGWHCDVFQPHGGCWAAVAQQKLLCSPPWLRPIKRLADPWLPRYRQHQLLEARQVAAAERILLALSHKVANEFQEYHHVPPSRIRVVYNGVDGERFSPQRRAEFRSSIRQRLGIGEDVVVALAVAHNFQLKGVPTLLCALDILAPKRLSLHVVVVGGKRLRSWQHRAKARRLPITFLGAQPDTVPFYAAADVFVHPSFYDCCSLVLLEAAASGLPLLYSRHDGAAELLSEGLEGLPIDDPADAECLAARMEILLDASLRARMGAAARQTALQHTIQRNFEEILAVYRQTAQSWRRAA